MQSVPNDMGDYEQHSSVSKSDPLVYDTDIAYVTPAPYRSLLTYLDGLLFRKQAVVGAGPEAPVSTDANLLHTSSVTVDDICDVIYDVWCILYASDANVTVRNFAFAEISILAEKWGSSLGPFTACRRRTLSHKNLPKND